jgi:hypothetical protein
MNAVGTVPPKRGWRIWVIAGVAVLGVLIAFGVAMYFMVTSILKDTDAYRIAMEKLQASPEAMAMLGPPLTTGMPSGSISTSGPTGEAALAIPVEGQKARGVLYVAATKDMGRWKASRIELEIEGEAQRFDLIRGGTPI